MALLYPLMASVNFASLLRTQKMRALSMTPVSPRAAEEHLCPMLKKNVPTIVRTGNQAAGIIGEGERADFAQIVQHLPAHSERISVALSLLRRVADSANGPQILALWKSLSNVCTKFDQGDMVKKRMSMDTPFEVLFDTMQWHDDAFVSESFQMLIQIPSVMPVPHDVRDDPSMFWDWAGDRITKLGHLVSPLHRVHDVRQCQGRDTQD